MAIIGGLITKTCHGGCCWRCVGKGGTPKEGDCKVKEKGEGTQ